jgi:uncharacterized protein YqeY
MSLAEKIHADLKDSLRNRDAVRTATLRMLISDIQMEGKKSGTAVDEVEEDTVISLVRRAIKARKEAIVQFEKGGRIDLAEKEKAEMGILETYLPAMLSEDATRILVEQTIAELGVTDRKGMGKVMGRIMSAHRSEVDGALVKRLVEETLG